jgi:hypothetical protein
MNTHIYHCIRDDDDIFAVRHSIEEAKATVRSASGASLRIEALPASPGPVITWHFDAETDSFAME